MEPSLQESLLAEDRVPGKAKSILLAYVIWVLTGAIGGHRFYLGKASSGVIMLLLFMIGLMTLSAGVGGVILAVIWFWALVDAVLIPGMIQDQTAFHESFGLSSIHSSGRLVGSDLDATKWWHADRERYLQQNELPHR